jgi:TRAP-type C4-dicarboxylate transport system substrate-binding protein
MKKAKMYLWLVLALTAMPGLGGAAAGFAADPVVLKVSIETNPGQARNKACEHWGELVKKYSDGRLLLEIYHSGLLGTTSEAMEGLELGTLDLTVQGSGLVGGTVPAFNIIYLAYRWASQEHLEKFLETQQFQDTMVKPLADHSIEYITSWESSPRHLMTKDRVVTKAADVKGMTLRVPGAAATIAAWEAMGCTTFSMPPTELYAALKQGIVEAVEQPIEALNGMSAPEVCKELSLTAHVRDAHVVLLSSLTRRKLSDEQYEILVRAAMETKAWAADRALSDEAALIEEFKTKFGVKVTEPDIQSFSSATADVVKRFTEQLSPGLDDFIRSLI